MRALTLLATEIYQNLGHYSNLTERKEATKQYILNEITQWTIKSSTFGDVRAFKPLEFVGDEASTPFEVRLVYDPQSKYHELKFGNLNAPNTLQQYKWNDKDPNRLLKAVFLQKVLSTKVAPLLASGKVNGVSFTPFDGDGLEDDRYSYFRNMFDRINTNSEYNLQNNKGNYVITKKV